MIAFLAAITLLPFYYMLLLSLKPIDALLLDPGSLWLSAKDFTVSTYQDVLRSTDAAGRASCGSCSTRRWCRSVRYC